MKKSRHAVASATSAVLFLFLCIGLCLCLLLAACVHGGETPPDGDGIRLTVLSGRAGMVTGGTALIGMSLPAGSPGDLRGITLTVNGADQSPAIRPQDGGSALQALVSQLAPGVNEVAVTTPGGAAGRLRLINHPRTGPVFSGPHLAPFECRTEESGLGPPLDADCSAATRFDWFYFSREGARKPLDKPFGPRPEDMAMTSTSEGKTVPFIVRVESGTLNRSIYRIAVLDDPSAPGLWRGEGWNRRAIFRFGESSGAQYNQGASDVTDVFRSDAADVQSITALGRGFVYIVSTLNIHKVNVNDVLSAETAMMLREHVAKTYGPPLWMLGMGGSGGAIQQMLIAQNYPGILDGIMPDAAFPDMAGTAVAVSDCRLLDRYFEREPASDDVRRAFEGHLAGTCPNWDTGLGDAVKANSGAVTPACGLKNAALVYDPVSNPGGARCSFYDMLANMLGRLPDSGHVRRPLDNVGVQYGLQALRAGRISAEQFLALNEKIGGFDEDGNPVAARTVADAQGLARAYQSGRIGHGGGGLAGVPIMQVRTYAEPAGDIHTVYNDLKIRAQLVRANGQADNQVIWVLPNPRLPVHAASQPALAALLRATLIQRLDLMTRWLDGLASDPAPPGPAKVAHARPADAVDSCWDPATSARIRETASFDGPGRCNTLFPKTPSPRMAAGGQLTDDVIKCQLKPVREDDYLPAVFTFAQRLRLDAVFPSGVCDHGRPGEGQAAPAGTWLSY